MFKVEGGLFHIVDFHYLSHHCHMVTARCACRMCLQCTCSSVVMKLHSPETLLYLLYYNSLSPPHHTHHTCVHICTPHTPTAPLHPIMRISSPTSRQHRVERIKQVMVSSSNMLLWACL